MDNASLAAAFEEIATLKELQGEDGFRSQAFRNTARRLETLTQSAADLFRSGSLKDAVSSLGKTQLEVISQLIAGEPCPTLDDLRARLEIPLADLGLGLFDVVRTGKGRGTVVQVMVDRPGGVDLELVTEATAVVSPILDEWPGIDTAYTLEVSSPGLERPLRRPSHFCGGPGHAGDHPPPRRGRGRQASSRTARRQ